MVIVDVLGRVIQYGSPFKIFVKDTKQYAPLTTCKGGGQKWVINSDAAALSQINTQYGNPQLSYTRRVTDANGNEITIPVKDTAYFYFAGNGSTCGSTVRRAIVFIDGFDPDNSRGVQQIFEDYINKQVTRNNTQVQFGDYMLNQGYDFIILDYKHGNDLLERNALTVVALLQRLNQTYGASYLQNIVLIGPSMGSLIAQYALAYMQNKNIPSRVKTYISFDGCHQGANIPIGLQNFVEYITKRGVLKKVKSIREGLYNGLAAKQLIAHHVSANSAIPAPDAFRTKFLNNLAALGEYPTSCRKVALINGANNGVLNPDHGSNTELLRMNLKRKGWKSIWGLCNDNICKIFDWTCKTAPSSGTAKVASMWTLSPLFNLLFWVPPGNTSYFGTATWNNSALDNAPAGLFKSIFGTEPGNINESNFQFILKESLYLLTGSKRFSFSQNLNKFSFIPSYNAADLRFANKNLYLNWSKEYLCGKTPFDYVYAPSSNQEHVAVTQEGSQWFENEAKCAVADLPTFITPVITQVTGSNPLCTNGTFQISTCKPIAPATITWSASPLNIVTIVSNGTQATITKTGSGSVTITAKVDFCNGYSVSAIKNIEVGALVPSLAIELDCPEANGIASNAPGATNYVWTLYSGGTTQISNGSSSKRFGFISGNATICVKYTNTCGTSPEACRQVYCPPPGGRPISVSPNPMTNNLTASFKISSATEKKKVSAALLIYDARITDKSGSVKKRTRFDKGANDVHIYVGDLPKDIYVLQLFDGVDWSSEKIIVQ